MNSLPRKIESKRLLLRTLDVEDASSVQQLLSINRNYMLPWIPWAKKEPEPVEDKIRQIRQWRKSFESLEKAVYGIFEINGSRLIGMMYVFNRRGPGTLEIGYLLDFRQQGKGYATEATQLLTQEGLKLNGIEKMLIYCSPENKPSARIPEKLGYSWEGNFKEEDGTELMIWSCTSPLLGDFSNIN